MIKRMVADSLRTACPTARWTRRAIWTFSRGRGGGVTNIPDESVLFIFFIFFNVFIVV